MNEQDYTVVEDTATTLVLSATDNDNDPLTYTIVTLPTNGTFTQVDGSLVVAGTALSAGSVIYTPNSNYNGPDSFQVKVNDGTVDSNTANCDITVTPVNDLPIIASAPWGTASSFTAGGSTITNTGVNSYVFSEGDAFSATATATDVEDPATSLTWTIVSENTATGSGDTTTPTWITGTVNSNGSYTIVADSTGIRAGNVVFYLKVTDTGGGFDYQEVQLGGITPTVNSYFQFVFDDSGSMDLTLDNLQRELLNENGNGTKYISDVSAYGNNNYLRYYLQDFFATGLTYDEETAANQSHNSATNGVDEYNAKVNIIAFSDIFTDKLQERTYLALNNGGDGFSTTANGEFPNASSVVIGVFQDEASGQTASYIGSDILALKTSVTSLNTNKGNGFYRGIVFPVEAGSSNLRTPFVNEWNSAVDPANQATYSSTANSEQGRHTSYNYSNLDSNGQQILDGNGNPVNHNLSSFINSSSPSQSNFNGPFAASDKLTDNSTVVGYYTEKVVDALRGLGYNLPAYGT